jgi:hypothetical protein
MPVDLGEYCRGEERKVGGEAVEAPKPCLAGKEESDREEQRGGPLERG